MAKKRGRKRKRLNGETDPAQADATSTAKKAHQEATNDGAQRAQPDDTYKTANDIPIPGQATTQPQIPITVTPIQPNFFTVPATSQAGTSQQPTSHSQLFTFQSLDSQSNGYQSTSLQSNGFHPAGLQSNSFQASNPPSIVQSVGYQGSSSQFNGFQPSNPPSFPVNPPIVQFTSPALLSPASTNNSGNIAQVGEAPTDPSGNATSIFQGFTSKGHSLAEGLELVSAAAGHVSSLENALANSFQDPIACGIVSDSEAHELVKYYFTHLQDCICLLDPELHTATYMRQNTLILLTAVLAVAAKFSREKHLHARLFAMAESAIKTAIFQPLYELQVIQAICILVCRFFNQGSCEATFADHLQRLERCHRRFRLVEIRWVD